MGSQTDRQTDRHTRMMNAIVAFGNCFDNPPAKVLYAVYACLY